MTLTMGTMLFAGLSLLAVATAAARARHPFGAALTASACGVAGLSAVNLLSGATGVSIALNAVTAFAAVVLGLPGVVTLLLLRGIFCV